MCKYMFPGPLLHMGHIAKLWNGNLVTIMWFMLMWPTNNQTNIKY